MDSRDRLSVPPSLARFLPLSSTGSVALASVAVQPSCSPLRLLSCCIRAESCVRRRTARCTGCGNRRLLRPYHFPCCSFLCPLRFADLRKGHSLCLCVCVSAWLCGCVAVWLLIQTASIIDACAFTLPHVKLAPQMIWLRRRSSRRDVMKLVSAQG